MSFVFLLRETFVLLKNLPKETFVAESSSQNREVFFFFLCVCVCVFSSKIDEAVWIWLLFPFITKKKYKKISLISIYAQRKVTYYQNFC